MVLASHVQQQSIAILFEPTLFLGHYAEVGNQVVHGE